VQQIPHMEDGTDAIIGFSTVCTNNHSCMHIKESTSCILV